MKKIKYYIRYVFMEGLSWLLAVLALIVPKKKGLILLGGFNGDHFGDNAASVLIEAIKKEYDQIVWLTNSLEVVRRVHEIGGKAVLRRSIKGIWLSLRASVFATSHSIKDVLMFVPFKGFPVFVYLHHGIPLRKGWLDLKNAPPKARKAILEKTTKAFYMIAPSVYAAKIQNKMYPIGVGGYKITGLPRNDILSINESVEAIKEKLEVRQNGKVMLYAPTWRPWGATRFFPFADFSMDELESFLLKNNFFLILRPHHLDLIHEDNYSFWKEIKKIRNVALVTHDKCSDVNEVAIISDVLITDYSSLYFDYLLLNKPVIFLDYDLSRYEKEIGFYLSYLEICKGPHPKTFKEFQEEIILQTQNDMYKAERENFTKIFHTYQDGKSSERVLKLLMELAVK